MKLKTRNYKCDNCEGGVVCITGTFKGDLVTTIAKNCNNCGKFFGIKGSEKLPLITNNIFTTIKP